MLNYPFQSLLVVLLFSLVHLFANHLHHRAFLSMGSGVAIAYVFIDLLPKISKHEPLVNQAVRQFFPYFERHVYVMALLGFLLFFVVDRSNKIAAHSAIRFYLSLSSYALLNIFIGYAVADKDNPEVKPLLLFTIAMSLHYFINDYLLNKAFKKRYDHIARWTLIACLFLGWFIGLATTISVAGVALISAFIGGGVIMNVTRHELPDEPHNSLFSFLISALFYTIILLTIG